MEIIATAIITAAVGLAAGFMLGRRAERRANIAQRKVVDSWKEDWPAHVPEASEAYFQDMPLATDSQPVDGRVLSTTDQSRLALVFDRLRERCEELEFALAAVIGASGFGIKKSPSNHDWGLTEEVLADGWIEYGALHLVNDTAEDDDGSPLPLTLRVPEDERKMIRIVRDAEQNELVYRQGDDKVTRMTDGEALDDETRRRNLEAAGFELGPQD